ncbi:hypothetical protein C8Q72DRAFT_835452 [Fomitopsis betulina]|nr:hypothetical protein C8Q72DRAFT_835452 [Fomitopsis betulina]
MAPEGRCRSPCSLAPSLATAVNGSTRLAPWSSSTQVAAPAPPAMQNMTREAVLASALQSAAMEGVFLNRTFCAYTRRSASGVVGAPQTVFANEALLRRTSGHFDTMFSWDAQEPCESTNDYDYMSDSDLDDADDADEAITTQSIPEVFEKTSTQTQLVSSTGEELPAATVKSISSSGSLEGRDTVSGAPGMIALQTVAFKTFRAFVIWSLTGTIAFAPLRSQSSSVHEQFQADSGSSPGPPACSSKSMYRLAHMFDISELRELALRDLQARLSKDNILQELRSSITARYTELQQMQVNTLVDHYITHESVLDDTSQWLADITDAHGLLNNRERLTRQPSSHTGTPGNRSNICIVDRITCIRIGTIQ